MKEIFGALLLGFLLLVLVLIITGLMESMFKEPGGR
jgi:hypothetical protein